MGSDSSQKKKIAIISVSSILLVAAVVGTVTYGVSRNTSQQQNVGQVSTSSKSVQTVCGVTDYKETCEKSLSNATDTTDIKQLIKVALESAIESVRGVINSSSALSEAAKNPSVSEAFRVCNESLDLSIYTLEKSIEKINGPIDKDNFDEFLGDLTTWLSGTVSFQEVCLDAFDNSTGETGEKVKELMKITRELSSNGLAMITELSHVLSGSEIPSVPSRKLFEENSNGRMMYDYYPERSKFRHLLREDTNDNGRILYDDDHLASSKIRHLLGEDARKILSAEDYYAGEPETKVARSLLGEDYDYYPPEKQARSLLGEDYDYYPPEKKARSLLGEDYDYYPPDSKARRPLGEDAKKMSHFAEKPHVKRLLLAQPNNLKPNAVVSLDGKGQFKSIQAAINKAPQRVNHTYIILVKAGIYREYVEIPKYVYNIMLIGEGPTRTRITGHKNFVDGTGTWYTATVGVNGDNFIARDIGFENSAGSIKHQAVALRVSADKAIFYNCHMDGYQDTLYTVSGRQFFRDCTITGTIDFIFGDAASVFQNCKLVVRKPLPSQSCMVTAQGRADPRSNGATVFQNCEIIPAPDYFTGPPTKGTFLGRPWKQYSRTLIMQSYIHGFIAPEGWSPWSGTFALDTLKYGEYLNRGPGNNTAHRVTWKGIQRITPAIAQSFTIGSYLTPREWLQPSGIPFEAGMMKV